VVCWAATEARLVSARYTETGDRASGMSRILYRGPETGDGVVRLELVGVKSTGVRVRGNLIPRRTCWRTRMDKEGEEKERGGHLYFNRLGHTEPKVKTLQKAIYSSTEAVDGRRTLERPKRRVGSG
jgi:hypothetical protein